MCIRDRLSAEHVLNVVARLNAAPVPDSVATTLQLTQVPLCLLYTSDAADERSSVDLGGCRIIKKKQEIKKKKNTRHDTHHTTTRYLTH